MRNYYTTDECPFTPTELESGFFGLPDSILSSQKIDIPLTSPTDPDLPMYIEFMDAILIDAMPELLDSFDDVKSLGNIFITDKKLILTIDYDFAKNIELPDEFAVRGLSTRFLCVLVSTHGLTKERALKVFLHEMCHFYGVNEHCDDPACYMYNVPYTKPERYDGMTHLCDRHTTMLHSVLEI